MPPQFLGILIGGIASAVFFGVSGFFSKAATQTGIGIGPYIIIAGIAISIVGIAVSFLLPDGTVSVRSGILAGAMGATWGIGATLVAIGLVKYQVPLSKLVPLYNMNTLIAVLLALWIFAEWQQVDVIKLLLGALLVVIGGTLVALA